MRTLIWIIVGVIGGKFANEILYNIFNSPNSGVNVVNAAIPALGGGLVLIFCLYKAFTGESNSVNEHFVSKDINNLPIDAAISKIIVCNNCSQKLRVSQSGNLEVKCPKCGNLWEQRF